MFVEMNDLLTSSCINVPPVAPFNVCRLQHTIRLISLLLLCHSTSPPVSLSLSLQKTLNL